MSTQPLSELLKLTDAERLQLAQDLWDSIPADSEALSLTDAHRDELDRRLEAHKADPGSAIPWQEARARLKNRFGA